MKCVEISKKGSFINIRVVPGASRNEICGEICGALKIRLQAPPVEGKANRALADFLAKKLGARRRNITIVSGVNSRTKRVHIAGMNPGDVTAGLILRQAR